MRVPQPDIIEHFGNADAVPQPPERCLSRQAGIVRCCLKLGVGGGAKARRFEAIYRDYFSLQVRNEKLKNMRNIGSGTGDRGSSGHCRAVYLVSLQHRAAWQRICGLCVLALKKS